MPTTNKKTAQKASREQHGTQKQARREAPSFERAGETRFQKEKILIVCDGENTEPEYFTFFKYNTARFESVKPIGNGTNTLTTVTLAEKLSKTDEYKDYQVWCVFDADPKPDNPMQLANFNNAIKKAEASGFGVAYSHQAFEFWLILHFEDHQGNEMHRDLYYKKINRYLKKFNPDAIYDKKSKKITEAIFIILQGIDKKTGETMQNLAIQRAKRIYAAKNQQATESSTTVFRLIEKLIGAN